MRSINTIKIHHNKSGDAQFPNEFKLIFNNETISFQKVAKNKHHPIENPNVYTVDHNKNVIKVNLKKANEVSF